MLALLLLIAATPAHAGVAAIEGTEAVYRGDTGRDAFYAEGTAGAVTFHGKVTAGPGCSGEPVVCSGATALRVITGEGDDDVGVSGSLPVFVDLGPGADEFDTVVPEGVRPQAMTLTAGDGDDRVGVTAHTASVDLGPGDDDFQIGNADREQITGPFAVNGGPGNDDLTALRAGTLAAPATVTIRIKSAARPYRVVASDRFRASAGAVRRSLRLRPVRSLRVEATFTTRTRGERTMVTVDARITSRRPGP
jgi:hypothetical protein